MKISLYVQPGSKESRYAGMYNGLPKIKIAAPPAGNAANKELISFLSKVWHVPKSKIEIVSGMNSRLKTVKLNLIDCKLAGDIAELLTEDNKA